jgi:CRISPR/Cas system-associated protein Csm6
MAPRPAAPAMSEGRIAARVFYLFDHGRELREIVEELEVPPGVVRDLWHEWMIDLGEGEMIRNKTVADDRRQRAEERERRDLERRSDQEQRNFETTMATFAASIAGGNSK